MMWPPGTMEGPGGAGTDSNGKESAVLILSRKVDEDILIGGLVTVRVVEIRGDKVRLGIDAPPQVTVDRREVWESKKRGIKNRKNEKQGS